MLVLLFQESEVSSVKYISVEEYKQALARKDPKYVPNDVDGQYGQLFDIIIKRYIIENASKFTYFQVEEYLVSNALCMERKHGYTGKVI